MTNENMLEDQIKKTAIIKNLNICETVLGIGGAITLLPVQPGTGIDYLLVLSAFVSCGMLFYHGVESYSKNKEKIKELNRKLINDKLEN